MKRVQIQLDELAYEAVRRLAFEQHKSISSTIRELLAQGLNQPPVKRPLSLKDFTFIGAMASGSGERVSEDHDEVLGEGRW